MDQAITSRDYKDIKPPLTSVGALGWMRSNLFSSFWNSVFTLVTLYFLGKIIPPFVQWALINATWTADSETCKTAGGACWSVITQNIRFISFGFYPPDQQWRPGLAMVMLLGLMIYSRSTKHWKRSLGYYWVIGLIVMGILMKGGILGLPSIESTQWGGLPLTLLFVCVRIDGGIPLGNLAGTRAAVGTTGDQNYLYCLHRADPGGSVDQPAVYVFGGFSAIFTGGGDV